MAPFLGGGVQYWRRLVDTPALMEVTVVGGLAEAVEWHNLGKTVGR